MKNEHIEWVSIDELIRMLEEEKEGMGGDGSIPVCVSGISSIYLDPKEYYYDGGYSALDSKDSANVKHSRDGQTMAKGFHRMCIDLRYQDDWPNTKFEGRSVVEVDPDRWSWYDKQQQEERAMFGGQLVLYAVEQARHAEWNCYPCIASLPSGESAIGRCMKDAKEALMKVYDESNNKTS